MQSYTTLYINYKSSYTFRPNSRAIFWLIFEQVVCKTDNDFNLRNLLLQELAKIIVVCYTKRLRLKLTCDTLYNMH